MLRPVNWHSETSEKKTRQFTSCNIPEELKRQLLQITEV